jgi:hypothetical protein
MEESRSLKHCKVICREPGSEYHKPKSITSFTITKRPTEMLTNLDLKLKMVANGTR